MVFSQVMSLIDWYRFQTCVQRYHGDTKTHALTTQEFFRIMVFAQLTGRESLRETVLCLNAVPSHLYHLGLPKRLIRSNIAHANHRRHWKIFYDFAMILLAEARTFYQTTPHDFNFDGCVYAGVFFMPLLCSNFAFPSSFAFGFGWFNDIGGGRFGGITGVFCEAARAASSCSILSRAAVSCASSSAIRLSLVVTDA